MNRSDLETTLDWSVVKNIEHFFTKINERLLYKMGELPAYDDGGEAALGETVEYFHFNICGDDRMRYLGKNIVLEDTLSRRNKLCNAVISHLYGGRCIHSLLSGITDPKKAHIDFERVNVDPDYVKSIYENAAYAKSHSYKFYGTTELHTSIQTAARNFCRDKYNEPERAASNTDIVEWVAGMITSGLVDDLLDTTTNLSDAYTKINTLRGVGAYYGYHLAVDASLIPGTVFHHDEQFCVPGPGCVATFDMMFPGLKQKVKKIDYGFIAVWIAENQQRLYPSLTYHEALWNIQHPENGKKMFGFEQDRLMVYGLEVGHCQYGIYDRLSSNPHLIEKRKCGSDPDLTPLIMREQGNPIQPLGKPKKAVVTSSLLEFE